MLGFVFELLLDRFTNRITAPPDDESRTVAAYRDAWTLRGGTGQIDETLRAQLERHKAPAEFADPSDKVGQYIHEWFRSGVSPRKMKRRFKNVLATL